MIKSGNLQNEEEANQILGNPLYPEEVRKIMNEVSYSIPNQNLLPFKIDIKKVMNNTIWKNKMVLSKGYPGTFKALVHRQKEIDRLVHHLGDSLSGLIPPNMFIYGKMGTGKTLVTKLVTQEIEKQGPEYEKKIKVVYIQCETLHTNISIIRELNEQLEVEKTKTGNAFDIYFKKFCKLLNNFNGILIIVLDEIDLLDDPNIINALCRLKENGFAENVCIIGITNNINFGDHLNPRTKSVLTQQNIVFSPYTAEQLRDILQERAEMAFKPGIFEGTIIPLCAAYAAQDNGDARKAIELLRTAGEIAESNLESIISEKNVEKAKQKIEQDKLTEVIETLPTQHKSVLISCLIQLKESINIVSQTGKIYNTYKKISSTIGIETVTQRRMTDILSELALMGIINAMTQNKGRHGRTKEITMTTRTEDIWNVLYNDFRFKNSMDKITEMMKNNQQSLFQGFP